MEQQDFAKKKNAEKESTKVKTAEERSPKIEAAKNIISENKCRNKGTLEKVHSGDVTSKSSDNPSVLVKDRGKNKCDKEIDAFCNIPLVQNKGEFKDTAKYRDSVSYSKQPHHSIGQGLFLTDEIEDLPPRYRAKVVEALKTAAELNNIKLDRNPLEYFTTFKDDPKQLHENQDKLVYIHPEVLEDKRKSSEKNSNFGPSLKTSCDTQHNSKHSATRNLDRRKPQFPSDNFKTQVPSQDFRNRTVNKSELPYTRNNSDNVDGSRQKSSRENVTPQFNVQNTSNLYEHTKSFDRNYHSNTKDNEHVTFYQNLPFHPPTEVEMSFDWRMAESDSVNQTSLEKDNQINSNASSDKYGKQISVEELFKQNKDSKATLENTEKKTSSKFSASEQRNSSSEFRKVVPFNNSRFDINTKVHEKKRPFTKSKTQYYNKKPYTSPGQYSAINSLPSFEHAHHADSLKPPKYSSNRTDSFTKNNTHLAESTRAVKSEWNQSQPDINVDYTDTVKCNEKSSELQNVQENASKFSTCSGKGNFRKFKNIPSKTFAGDKNKNYDERFSKTENAENYPHKEKHSYNSFKIVNTPPEKGESNMVHDLPLKNTSVQNRKRTSDSHSSVSSSHSSKSYDKVPQHSRKSFESFSHQKPIHKQFDRRDNFNRKSKSYRSSRDKDSDSSSVISDNSIQTYNSSNNSISNEICSQRSSKNLVKSPVKHFKENSGKKFLPKPPLISSDQGICIKKPNSCSTEYYHHFNKTNSESNRTTYNKKYGMTSIEKENNSRLCTAEGFFVKVEVSENSTDLEYWMNNLKNVFQFRFELEACCRFSNVLIIEFERKDHALIGLSILHKQKKILQNLKKPHFLLITNLLYRLTKPCNCSIKVISDCLDNIKKHFDSALDAFNEKIESSKSTPKKPKYKNNFKSTENSISESFEESISNFTKFMDQTICDVKVAEDLRSIQQLKYSFIRECNIFKRCLPIYSKKVEILDLARFHSVSVIVAETGSGKSTQVVEYLMHSPISERGVIICTQPRKLAAISVAQYVSGQIGSAIGKIVGYDVGTEKKCNEETKILYMTDYCLLKYFLKNKNLNGVSCIIIDEAHERSLYTDLIFGLLKKCLNARRDLSVLITSATINPTIFVDYFKMPEQCVIEVPGRTYPVDVIWLKKDVEIGWNYLDACVHTAYDIHKRNGDGDILVFLTSPGESEEAIYLFKRLLTKKDKKAELLNLHGKTDIQEQMIIFQKTYKTSRKIIFATNVAETAVTIPGIKYVVDSGMSKELMFDPQKNKSYLAVTFTTKSAAEQRKGRAGRTQSGICYRMYSERNYAENMADNIVPEILKSNLQRALLKIFEFGIDPESFDFIEAPPARTISNSVESLENLGAIENKKLTDFGKKLAKLPLEPQLSKLVLQGIKAKIGIEAIIIAALVSESGKLFIRNEENRAIADEKKKKFCHAGGDLCTFLEIYKRWKEVDIPKRYDWCVENFVSFKGLSAAAKTVKEILITLRTELGIRVSSVYNNNDYKKQYENIIFDSFSENLCVLSGHPKLGYLSPYLSESFFIHPSSTLTYLGKDSPEFLVYSTLMETSRNFLFDVTPISETTLKSAYQAGKMRLPIHTLRCLQVPPKIMGPFGESVLIRHILGKGGIKIKDLEKKLIQLTSVKTLYVDVDVIKGLITIYLSKRLHEKAENHIHQIISKALAEMLNEEDVVKLTGSCMHFALSAGGIINDIVMPGEFRELVFNRVMPKDSSKLENILQVYGPLQSFTQVTGNQEKQICVTFKKVCDAKKAYLDLKHKEKYYVSPKPYLPSVSNKSSPLHMLLISWCCCPSTGYGSVKLFSEEDLIVASGILTCNSFFVGNNLIMFQVSEEKHTLAMKNLPEYVEESTISEKLKESLPPDIKIKSIQIKRKSVKNTNATVEDARNKLSKLLRPYISDSKYVIDLKDPQGKASWNAVVYFDSVTDAENIYMKLKDNVCIDSYPLSIQLNFKCQLYCKQDVFHIISEQVKIILEKKKAEGVCDLFSIKFLNRESSNVQIEFSCKSIDELYKTRQDLCQFIDCTYLNFIGKSNYHFLFSEVFAGQIRKIQISTKTLIDLHEMKKSISIHGNPSDRYEAEKKIRQLANSEDNSFIRTFNLKDSCIPSGFLKQLYSKYGYDLNGLVVSLKLTIASIDNNGSTLTLKGPKDRIRKAEQILEKMCEELFRSRGQRQKTSNEEDCPICLDPISFDFQRLEHCGHAFCRQCLLLQLESKTMPLVCVKQDCGKLIFLEDIKRIISFGGSDLKKTFCAVALHHHVRCNIGKLSYCHTPDCQLIYRVTEEGSEYCCPGCKNATCTRCQSPYHYGMSCEMYQECKKDVDYPLKMWVKAKESSRKYCPSCGVVIEKVDGCNHMECLNCKAHLCWLCLKVFSNSDLVYSHMPYCPKNQTAN